MVIITFILLMFFKDWYNIYDCPLFWDLASFPLAHNSFLLILMFNRLKVNRLRRIMVKSVETTYENQMRCQKFHIILNVKNSVNSECSCFVVWYYKISIYSNGIISKKQSTRRINTMNINIGTHQYKYPDTTVLIFTCYL